jgi:hypothetical protein
MAPAAAYLRPQDVSLRHLALGRRAVAPRHLHLRRMAVLFAVRHLVLHVPQLAHQVVLVAHAGQRLLQVARRRVQQAHLPQQLVAVLHRGLEVRRQPRGTLLGGGRGREMLLCGGAALACLGQVGVGGRELEVLQGAMR